MTQFQKIFFGWCLWFWFLWFGAANFHFFIVRWWCNRFYCAFQTRTTLGFQWIAFTFIFLICHFSIQSTIFRLGLCFSNISHFCFTSCAIIKTSFYNICEFSQEEQVKYSIRYANSHFQFIQIIIKKQTIISLFCKTIILSFTFPFPVDFLWEMKLLPHNMLYVDRWFYFKFVCQVHFKIEKEKITGFPLVVKIHWK